MLPFDGMSRDPPRLIGRYEVYGVLASGGMALVHMGRLRGAQGFSKPVAVKRLHAQYANDPEFVAALLEEARLSERIRHANVVATLDVVAEDGELLLVMEYVHGETLARLLRSCAECGSPCPPSIAAAIAHDVLLGLDAAHRTRDAHGNALQIVHRDISPQNVLIGADGSARLLDFGIAKAVGGMSTTREGHVRGKVPYMAPEQLQFKPATHQTDVYALAVVLWETLCARRLFRGGSDLEVWGKVLAGEIRTPSEVLGDAVPLDAVVMRGLDRDPARRYTSALEMAQEIERTARRASPTDVANWVATLARDALGERSAMLREVETAPPVATSPSVAGPAMVTGERQPGSLTPSATAGPAERPKRRGSAILVGALAFLLVLGAGGAFGLGKWRARAAQAASDGVGLVPTANAPGVTAGTPGTPPAASALAQPQVPPLLMPAGPEATPSVPPTAPSASASASRPVRTGPSRAPVQGGTGANTGSKPLDPAPKPTADPCDPPFWFDEAGRKHFKLSCVAGQ